MSLALILHAYSLRYMMPASIMLGSSPTFFTIWAGLRILTVCLPRNCYTRLDDRLYALYQSLVLFFFNTLTGVQIKTYGDTSALFGKKENVIVLFNHQCTVDWIVANMLASTQGSIGSIRYILKDGLRFFPLYGFYFKQHSCIYVKRDKKFHQVSTEKQLAALKNNNIPVWLIIFPEGTRFNPDLPDVIKKSKQFAREQATLKKKAFENLMGKEENAGLEELNYVLMPKSKGLQLSLEQLQGHVTALYDVTIAYSNTKDKMTGKRISSPGMLEFLDGFSPEVHLHFERIPIEDLPKDEPKLKQWLYTRFQYKDRLLSYFYSKNAQEGGCFPGQAETLKISKMITVPAFLFFGSCLAVLLGTEKGRAVYWRASLYGSIAGILWMSVKS